MKIGLNLIVVGFFLVALWIYTAFWPTTKAEILSLKTITFHQSGYAEGPITRSFKGGSTYLSISKYAYEVEGKKYYGIGTPAVRTNSKSGFQKIQIRYLSFLPSLSVSSRSIMIISAFAIIFLGLGLRAIRLKVTEWLK